MWQTTFSCVFLLGISLLSQGTCCPSGWLEYRDSCYEIITNILPKQQADYYCAHNGAILASISGPGKLAFLGSQVSLSNQDYFWVGLLKSSGNFTWNDGTNASNVPWVDVPKETNDGSCFVFYKGKVVPRDCTFPSAYICEVKKSYTTGIPKAVCPQGTTTYGEKCFWPVTQSMTHDASENECTDKKGYLAVLNFDAKKDYVISLIHLNPGKYWIGLNKNGSDYVWKNGEKADQAHLPWPTGETLTGTGECFVIETSSTSAFGIQWKLEDCKANAFGLCEREPEIITSSTIPVSTTIAPQASCPSGYSWKEYEKNNHCYWETSYETERLSWEDARKYCQSFGGDLASFQNLDEEKFGLSFQYGSLSHSYWIGLKHNIDTDQYEWSDGSELNYTNWANNQPNNKDRRLSCVSMNAELKEWKVDYCGILNWFVCKAEKRINPPNPVPPTPEPLTPCLPESSSMFFQDYCYRVYSQTYSWHRARTACENQGASLVSIHSLNEIDFLLRLLHSNPSTRGNRVWIGLDSLGIGGVFQWADGTNVDFTNWNDGEPNNFQNQEKCCNMYIGNAFWNDENCNAVMGFICKWLNGTDTSVTIRPTKAPVQGHCKTNWYEFDDSCYFPIGEKETERANWTDAEKRCSDLGGHLASIHSSREQALVEYLMLNVKQHTWIGFHDSIHDGVYFWTDNSPSDFNNWATGQPSNYGLKEDCVLLTYGGRFHGEWHDQNCDNQNAYICKTFKDPKIQTPSSPGKKCLNPQGWTQLGSSCYKLYQESHTWDEAEKICVQDKGHLVSVRDFPVESLLKHFASEINDTFWIGLRQNKENKIKWIGGWHLTVAKWGKTEPQNIDDPGTCFLSSNLGLWGTGNCSEARPFVCEVSSDVPTTDEPVRGSCPTHSGVWIDLGSKYCYAFEGSLVESSKATTKCYQEGGSLASFHSMEELNRVGKVIKYSSMPVFIGLGRNRHGGFAWTDGTPVDFVNWDQGEPESEKGLCVQMNTVTLKWNVVNCYERRGYICTSYREEGTDIITDSPPGSTDHYVHGIEEHRAVLSSGAIAGIVILFLIVIIFGFVACFYFRQRKSVIFNGRRSSTPLPTSFENALFTEEPSLDFQNLKGVSYLNQIERI